MKIWNQIGLHIYKQEKVLETYSFKLLIVIVQCHNSYLFFCLCFLRLGGKLSVDIFGQIFSEV